VGRRLLSKRAEGGQRPKKITFSPVVQFSRAGGKRVSLWWGGGGGEIVEVDAKRKTDKMKEERNRADYHSV